MLAIQHILGFTGLIGKVFANNTSAPTAVKVNLAAATNPSVSNDSASGYGVGSEWYNLTLDKAYICTDATVGAAVWREVGARVTDTVVQVNSFAAGAVLKREAGTWSNAQANTAANARVIGVVEEATGTEFTIVYSGKMRVASHGFTVGAVLFLSPNVAGTLTASETTTPGEVSKPVAIAVDANNLVIINDGGVVVTSTGLTAASQAQMEAASSNVVGATPGVLKYHPGVAKVWVKFSGTGTPTIVASQNVDSIGDNGTGDYSVNFTTAFSSNDYSFSFGTKYDGTDTSLGSGVFAEARRSATNPSTTGCRITTAIYSGTALDPAYVSANFHGDQ